MMRLVFWAMLGLTGCGGKYIDDGSGGAGDPVSDPASTAGGGSSGNVGNAKDGSYANPAFPKHPLGICSPGFDHANNPARACPWITEAGQCFATNAAACSCACPTDHDSVCYSDFDSPETSTLVHCS